MNRSHTESDPDDRARLMAAVAERGKAVWVVFGVYLDRSGSKILGIYTDQLAAEDRVKLAREAGAALSVGYAKVYLDKAFPVELNPFPVELNP